MYSLKSDGFDLTTKTQGCFTELSFFEFNVYDAAVGGMLNSKIECVADHFYP